MATNFFKIRNGITLGSLSSNPSNPSNGDLYYNTTSNSFQIYQNSAWDTISTGTIFPLTAPNGSASAPSYSYSSSTGTGEYSPATNQVGWATNGIQAGYFDQNQNLYLSNALNMEYSTTGNPSSSDTGAITWAMPNSATAFISGWNANIGGAGFLSIGAVSGSSGSMASRVAISADTSNITIYGSGSNVINFQTNNVANWQVSSAGHLLAQTDSTFNIGASSANRPANVYSVAGTFGSSSTTATALTAVGGTYTAGEVVSISATLSSASATVMGSYLNFATTGASTHAIIGQRISLTTGSTTSGQFNQLYLTSSSSSSGSALDNNYTGNFGLIVNQRTTPPAGGSNMAIAVDMQGTSSAGDAVGLGITIDATSSPGAKYGVLATVSRYGSEQVAAGYFTYGTGQGNYYRPNTSAVIIANNRAQSLPIFIGQANSVSVFEVDASGNLLSVTDGGINIGAVGANRPANIYAGTSVQAPVFNSSASQTTLTGSAGTAVCSQPEQGSSHKKVVIYLNGYTNTGTQTYTFPTAFTYTPYVYGLTAGVSGASVSTTSVTFTTTLATGFVFLEGY
jgi:hypothetical protein